MAGLADNPHRLAWIFGSSRSGSTWLLKMLSELDRVVAVDDPHLGHHLGVWRPLPLAWAVGEKPPELTTLLDLKADEPGFFFAEEYRASWEGPLRDLIAARFEAQDGLDPRGAADRVYVVKEPGSHVAPLLAGLFRGCKLIFLLRDGRDVVDSWLDAYQRDSWAIDGGAFPVTEEGRLPLIRWLAAAWEYRTRAVWQAYQACAEGDRILVRYDDLRDNTQPVLADICRVLGLEASGLDEVVERYRFEDVPPSKKGSGCEIRAASPGGWRENLSTEEQRVLNETLMPTLVEFGLDREPASSAA